MAVTRLSDSQKKELVERFCAGEGSQALAQTYGCSTATVIRAVRAALSPAEYEGIKQQGGRRASASPSAAAPAAGLELEPVPDPPADPPESQADTGEEAGAASVEEDSDEAPGVLAIDDADDFGDDDDDDLLDEAGDDADGDGDEASMFVPIAPIAAVDDHGVVEVIPLSAAQLPPSAYMLVDKTVELQAQPLSDFPELGRLAPEEQQRQALVVFANPRQARRQCGRSQRVIKLPDTTLLERTSRYLLAQGISRVVIEGALYSLPGS
ncbi:MAG: hypothetical protein ACKOBY_05050 [Cyanobium sp.]